MQTRSNQHHLKRSSSVVFFVWSHGCFSASLIDILISASSLRSFAMKSCTVGGVSWPSKQRLSTHPSAHESKSRWSQPYKHHHYELCIGPAPPFYSGARYFLVPVARPDAFARPKSIMTGSPNSFWRRMLSGLMSR